MKVFVSDSANLTIVAPTPLYSGVPAQIGGITCVPVTSANTGELVSVFTEGVVELNLTGSAKIGDPLYFNPSPDGTTYTITNQPATGVAFGFAAEASTGGLTDMIINNSVINLSAYIQTSQLNAAIIKAVTDPTVKAAIKTAATT